MKMAIKNTRSTILVCIVVVTKLKLRTRLEWNVFLIALSTSLPSLTLHNKIILRAQMKKWKKHKLFLDFSKKFKIIYTSQKSRGERSEIREWIGTNRNVLHFSPGFFYKMTVERIWSYEKRNSFAINHKGKKN